MPEHKRDTTEASDQREQYIEDHLNAIKDRQAAELITSRRYFAIEFDEINKDSKGAKTDG